jgi:hypothetical protein
MADGGGRVLQKGVDRTLFLVSTQLGADLHKSQRRQALNFVAVSGADFPRLRVARSDERALPSAFQE